MLIKNTMLTLSLISMSAFASTSTTEPHTSDYNKKDISADTVIESNTLAVKRGWINENGEFCWIDQGGNIDCT